MTNTEWIKVRGNETFVLVHGAWHGAWCWEKTEKGLRALGHKTVAVELPAHGKDTRSLQDQSLQTYVDEIVKVLDEQEKPVILVGHSMGGVLISLAAEARPEKVKKLVYAAAFLLKDGQSGHGMDTGVKPRDLYAFSPDGRTAVCSEKMLKERYAFRCSKEDQERICANLCDELIEPLVTPVHITKENWGSIPRYFIAGTYDPAIDPETVQKMLEALPCEKVYEVASDHDLFDSAPEEFLYALNDIAFQ